MSIFRGQLLFLVFSEIFWVESDKKGWNKALVYLWCLLSFSVSKAAPEAYGRTGATGSRLCRELDRAASPSPRRGEEESSPLGGHFHQGSMWLCEMLGSEMSF